MFTDKSTDDAEIESGRLGIDLGSRPPILPIISSSHTPIGDYVIYIYVRADGSSCIVVARDGKRLWGSPWIHPDTDEVVG